MSNTPVRVPKIKSEIAVAIAYLGWSMRQIAEFSALIGWPISEHFLEDALAEPWGDFRSKSDPVRTENLIRVLNSLGIELRDEVFGVVPRIYTRMTVLDGISSAGAVMALVANYPKAQLRLTIQEPAADYLGRYAALLINTGNRYIVCDDADLDPSDLINYLYANCLDRLWVADYVIRPTNSSADDTVQKLLKNEFRSAMHLSRGRVAELLRGEK